MNIIVCVKQIPDPETPPASFKIDPEAKKAIPAPGVAPVINPFDEQAVEAALRIKDAHDAKVTVLSLGPASARDVLKHAMAMGADEGFLLDTSVFEGSDSYATALALSTAIKKIGEYDLIFCGRQAGDWDNGQVGLGIAELLGIPSVIPAQKAEVADGKVLVERVIPDGYEILEMPTPALIAVSNELGEPRYATLKGIMTAAKKEVTVWNAQELGLEPAQVGPSGARTKILKLFIPVREAKCFFVEGETLEEAATNLALKLREDKVV